MHSINTPRLLIRSLELDDISNSYVLWLTDTEVNKYMETRFQVHDYRTCKEFVTNMKDNAGEELFGIFLRANNEHIGNCKLGAINRIHHTAEISFFIGKKSCWGLGYASEAVNYVVQYGFNFLDLVKITAGCYEDNLGSKTVLLKSGFEIEGLLKQQVVLNGNIRTNVFKFGIIK